MGKAPALKYRFDDDQARYGLRSFIFCMSNCVRSRTLLFLGDAEIQTAQLGRIRNLLQAYLLCKLLDRDLAFFGQETQYLRFDI